MKPTISDKAIKKESDKNDQHLSEKELLLQLNTVNSKLLASENLKSNFLSNIRNEINNPLASVLELSKNIAEGNLSAEQVKKFAGLIYSEIFNLDFQLRNIFFSAEIEAGEISLSAVSVNVSTLLQNAIGALDHQVQKKKLKIALNNNLPENSLFFTDSEKFYLILNNVLANAIQFSHEEGTIDVNVSINDGLLKISVSDHGVGISEENKNLIFDRFRQGDEGATKNYGGHGLGLSICKALLEIINGELIVESEPLSGSTFIILINEVKTGENKENTFSSDGNDFLFNDSDSLLF